MNIRRYVFAQPCTRCPASPTEGVSSPLGLRKSCTFTFKSAAGSFAVDSTDVTFISSVYFENAFPAAIKRHLKNVPLQRPTPVLSGSRSTTIFGLLLDPCRLANDSFAFLPCFRPTLTPECWWSFEFSLSPLEQIRDAAVSFRALREWRPCSPGKYMTSKVSIWAFLFVTLGLTSSQRREKTSRVLWDMRDWSVCRFPVKQHIFRGSQKRPSGVFFPPVCIQRKMTFWLLQHRVLFPSPTKRAKPSSSHGRCRWRRPP